jgi:hypothetical protein
MPMKFVRSSAPLIAPVFSQEDILFYKWLAGFVDGDACFYHYEKRNETSLQIKQATWNLHLLEQLKERFGGSIRKITDGGKTNSHHYSLAQRDRVIEVLHGVNGYIRGTSRTVQFKKFCEIYNIIYIEPHALTKPDDPYLAGMFDADGSISLYNTDSKKGRGLTISMSGKYKDDIECYKTIFGGNITTRPIRDCSDWQIGAQKDVLFAQESLVKNLKSNKLIRFKLIHLFYKLRGNKAYLEDSPFFKDWEDLLENWYNNGADFHRRNCKGRPYTQEARDLKDAKKKFKEDIEDMIDKIITNTDKFKT